MYYIVIGRGGEECKSKLYKKSRLYCILIIVVKVVGL